MKSSNTEEYTCNEYREEMILLSLRQKLASGSLTKKEKENIERSIKKIEQSMGM